MPRSEPTPDQARELTEAAVAGFGKCDCHAHPDGRVCQCAGHEWLTTDPTRRMGVRVWQRLLWMRSQADALRAQEGTLSPAPVRWSDVDVRGVLPF